MSSYTVTMDEFLQLYQDYPDYKLLYKTNVKARNSTNGNTNEVNKEIKNMKKGQLRLKKFMFWKKGEDTVNVYDPEDVNNNGEAVKRKNPVTKILKKFGRVMLRHFYFMNVAIENTGGLYVVRYGAEDDTYGMHLEYCYTSSYAATRSSLSY